MFVMCACVQTKVGWTDLNAGQNFTQEDVEMNRLWYKHTNFKGHDRFHFFLTDGDNQTPPQSFFISVHMVPKGMKDYFCLNVHQNVQATP